jgi:hypothetical protein
VAAARVHHVFNRGSAVEHFTCKRVGYTRDSDCRGNMAATRTGTQQ